MPVLVPTSLDEALEALARVPEATLLAGGTDVMVEINEGHRALAGSHVATTVISLSRISELTTWTLDRAAARVTIGSGVTWSEIETEPLRTLLPALAEAARTVGSPQIRHAATLGGNLATCSPAGDGLPVLAALEATIALTGPAGSRTVAVGDFMLGVKRTDLRPGELIESITLPVLDGWQGYSKVGVRNAMVIATASACLASDTQSRSIRLALGSVAPTIIRCPDAEAFAIAHVDWSNMSVDADTARRAGQLAAAASRPIDDHRSTAEYRRHAVGVMATRLLERAFSGSVS